jgi:hypothetical protein
LSRENNCQELSPYPSNVVPFRDELLLDGPLTLSHYLLRRGDFFLALQPSTIPQAGLVQLEKHDHFRSHSQAGRRFETEWQTFESSPSPALSFSGGQLLCPQPK